MPPEIVYIVEHRIAPNRGGSLCEMEREASYMSKAFTSKNQAYRTAIREQIEWLRKSQPLLAEAAAQINSQKGLSVDSRLVLVQDKFDEMNKSQQTTHKWEVKEIRSSDVKGLRLSENSDHSSDDEDDVQESDEDEEKDDEGEGEGEGEGQGAGGGEEDDDDDETDEGEESEDDDEDELDELEDEEDEEGDDDEGDDEDEDDEEETDDEDVDDDARSAKRPRH